MRKELKEVLVLVIVDLSCVRPFPHLQEISASDTDVCLDDITLQLTVDMLGHSRKGFVTLNTEVAPSSLLGCSFRMVA